MNNNFKSVFRLRNLFLAGNTVLLALFVAVLIKDQERGWKSYQKEFRRKELARAEKSLSRAASEKEKSLALEELHAVENMRVEIRQLWSEEMGAVDRCVTCHLGHDPIENPSLATVYGEHPFLAPTDSKSYEIHRAHNVEKFGCVVCHGGQGIATEVEDAHGHVAHWESPLLTGVLLQASCARCHDNLSELKVQGEVYASEILRAKELYRQYACVGCHQIAGEGGGGLR